ncbi:MAG: hypothetical protein V3W52_17050 [Syntrophobacteria bacterium]
MIKKFGPGAAFIIGATLCMGVFFYILIQAFTGAITELENACPLKTMDEVTHRATKEKALVISVPGIAAYTKECRVIVMYGSGEYSKEMPHALFLKSTQD